MIFFLKQKERQRQREREREREKERERKQILINSFKNNFIKKS